jgi:hypothetical protein
MRLYSVANVITRKVNTQHQVKRLPLAHITIIRKRSVTGKRKSVGPDGVCGEILNLGGEAMTSYLARLLDITVNNNAIPDDWKQAIVVPFYKGGDRSVVRNYKPASITSVVCKQVDHVIAGYRRQAWEMMGGYVRVSMVLDQGTPVKVK